MEVESTLREVLTRELSKGVMHLEKRSKCQLIPWMSQEESIVRIFFRCLSSDCLQVALEAEK